MIHDAPRTPPGPPLSVADVPRLGVRGGAAEMGIRVLAEECPIAMTFNGSTYAVMMASPCDLEDFAVGFAVTEAVVDGADEIRDLDVIAHDAGYEARMWVDDEATARLDARRRHLLGPVGCGLCGLESIAEAIRTPATVPDRGEMVAREAVALALRDVENAQAMNRRTRSHHAAALWTEGGLVLREDVGRHNALDKLAGACIRSRIDLAGALVIVTSRVSVDLVQKVTRLGASILVAVSAPTALAVRSAAEAGLTLVGVARDDGFEIYSRPDRIV